MNWREWKWLFEPAFPRTWKELFDFIEEGAKSMICWLAVVDVALWSLGYPVPLLGRP